MEKIKIISDTTADIHEDIAKAYNIDIIPLRINIGDQMYEDQVNLTTDQIYEFAQNSGLYPKTCATPTAFLEEIFQKYLDEGYKIIYMTISSKISSTYEHALSAINNLNAEGKVFAIDSGTLSNATELQILDILEDIHNGLPIEEIVERATDQYKLMRGFFAIDTMQFLHKGGRCSSLTAWLGKALKLHPVITLKDQIMTVYKVKPGKLENALDTMVKVLKKDLESYSVNRVVITASKADKYVEYIRSKLEKLVDSNIITFKEANGVIACHCGPGTVGIFYKLNDKSDEKPRLDKDLIKSIENND